MKSLFLTILELANHLNRWTGPTRPGRTVTIFDSLFLEKYKKKGIEILTQGYQSKVLKNWRKIKWSTQWLCHMSIIFIVFLNIIILFFLDEHSKNYRTLRNKHYRQIKIMSDTISDNWAIYKRHSIESSDTVCQRSAAIKKPNVFWSFLLAF